MAPPDQTQGNLGVVVAPNLMRLLAATREVDYLRSLLDLVTARVFRRPGAPDKVTPEILTDQFLQPFSDIASGAIAAADQPIHPARIAVEILRSYLNRLNVPDAVAASLADAEARYRLRAYQALLSSIGTSYDEIRLIRGAENPERTRLAQRLGVLPAQLNALLVTDRVTEPMLERVFGLLNTTRDPGEEAGEPELLAARKVHLRSMWKLQDHPADPQAAAAILPLVDPDLIGSDDIVQPSTASRLWEERRSWVEEQLSALRTDERPGEAALARFDRLVDGALGGGTIAQLQQLASELAAGHDVRPQISSLGLSFEGFSHLLRLRALTAAGLVESEWEEFYSILVQTLKVRRADIWREEEDELFLGPDFFRLSPVTPAPTLPAWRANDQARRARQQRLRARIAQESTMVEAHRASVAAVEDLVLPWLRDELVAAVRQVLDDGQSMQENVNLLTTRLFTDFADTGAQRTTRVGQAIETVQGVLFALRGGRLKNLPAESGANPLATWTITSTDQFDQEWMWLGTFDTWRAAEEMFHYPENDLRPSLRQTPPHSHEFQQLSHELTDQFQVTSDSAGKAFDAYVKGAGPHIGLGGVNLRDLALRREQSKRLIPVHPSAQGISNYLWEMFYDAPMYTAQRLQESGQFTDALDYYRLVYAFDLPPGDDRYIFSVLRQEQGLTSRFDRQDWLLRSLNPHDVAVNQSRAGVYTRFVVQSVVQCLLDFADTRFTAETPGSLAAARVLYLQALDLLDDNDLQEPTVDAGRAPNQVVWMLRQRAERNLAKLRGGRNIAGLQRAPTAELRSATTVQRVVAPQATPYRYSTLIDRAKQLIGLAQQAEAAFLTALEKRDAEAYNLLRAGTDLALAQAQIRVHESRIIEATNQVALADLQIQRSILHHSTYNAWISAGVIPSEQALLDSYDQAKVAQDNAADAETLLTVAQPAAGFLTGLGAAIATGGAAGWAGAATSALSFLGIGGAAVNRESKMKQVNEAQRQVQLHSFQASYDRRLQEWQLQQTLTAQDLQIAYAHSQAATDHVDTVVAEWDVAQLQVDHDRMLLEFLDKKFTNVDLYQWMSGVLMRVYGYFLQQATAVARLAESQLAFERQEMPASFIQVDYQRTPERGGGAGQNGQSPERLGLTGSARLLQDIHRLDQYAFDTNKRKLQLTKTLSLARLAPQEFHQFRDTGVLPFTTPMALFDADFPGHYLRLIRRVRVSLVALIPPVQGIKATLSSSGISRVTLGPPMHETAIVAQEPESVALTSPSNATGLFELDIQPELLLPFEGSGVDATWQLELPKPANAFDYNTIADVLISIDYTAQASPNLRDVVIERLTNTTHADRTFSVSDDFPDQWYDLHNPDHTPTPMQITVHTRPDDFPVNLTDLRIENLLLYLVPVSGPPLEVELTLTFTPSTPPAAPAPPPPLGGPARSIRGVASTARGNAEAWRPILGRPAVGTWTLSLPTDGEDGAKLREALQNGQIRDILLLVSYAGTTSPWPSQL